MRTKLWAEIRSLTKRLLSSAFSGGAWLAVQDKAQEDDVFISYAGATELTAELAGTFIKEILVSSPTEIEIVWKFRDVFNMQGNDNR